MHTHQSKVKQNNDIQKKIGNKAVNKKGLSLYMDNISYGIEIPQKWCVPIKSKASLSQATKIGAA